MPKLNDVHSIIVPAQSPVFSAHTYTEIYGGSAGCTANINGTVVSIGPQSSISIGIRSISGGTGCFLLGENQNVALGSTGLGGIN
jgi:hypothetical protein